MTYKQIEASRELRLWIGQVIVPTVSVMAVVLANPDVRKVASEKLDNIKQKFQSRKIRVVKQRPSLLYFPHLGDWNVW